MTVLDNIQITLAMEMVQDAPDLLEKMQGFGSPVLVTQIRTRQVPDWFDAGEIVLATVDPDETEGVIVAYSRKQCKLATLPMVKAIPLV